jgi:hypothetical protein
MKYIKIIVITLIVVISVNFLVNNKAKEEIKIGQKWVFYYDTLNPFEPKRIDTCTILKIKGDYVLIKNNNIITSCKKDLIIKLYEKI